MFEQLSAIVRNTFVESIRQPIYLVLVGVGILALVLNLGLTGFTMDDDNKFLLDMGLATIFLVGLLIAAFVATSVLTQEIENRTVLTVVSKPVGRPLFIVGKYLGVSAAIGVATVILGCAFMLTIRHRVLQTARDDIDWPVFVFGFASIILSVGVGVWCNYFYGWVFSSATVGALAPLTFAAWLGSLAVSKDWTFQLFNSANTGARWISPDLDAQMLMALAAMLMALLVMGSVAIAASARLGQVMTIFACVLVFLIGLLNDHIFGQRAYEARALARIMEIVGTDDVDGDFSDAGDRLYVRVDKSTDLRDNQSIVVAADPMGLSIVGGVGADDDAESGRAVSSSSGADQSIRVQGIDQLLLDLVRTGAGPIARPPRVDDFLLAAPPKTHWTWRLAWSIPPDLQFLVMIDPLTQGHPIPPRHLGLLALYSLGYITAMLCLAILLFQKREVG